MSAMPFMLSPPKCDSAHHLMEEGRAKLNGSRIPWRANIVLEVTFPEATFSKQVSKITIFLLFTESETKEVSGYALAEKLGGWLDDLLDA